MAAEEFAHKPRTRTVASVYAQYVANQENRNRSLDVLRDLDAEASALLAELDVLLADAKAENVKLQQELAAVEASIPRSVAKVTPAEPATIEGTDAHQ